MKKIKFELGKEYKVKMTTRSVTAIAGVKVRLDSVSETFKGKITEFRATVMEKAHYGRIVRIPISSLEEINEPIENVLYEIF